MFSPVIISLALAAGQSDPPIKVSLNSDVYSAVGDVAQVRVKAAQDGYVVILRAGADGRIRVILPLDPGSDNFVRGGKDYGVRGRGDRDGFAVDDQEGAGLVLAAWSASPFTFDHFVRGDHWDFRVLGAVPSDQDAETVLLDVVREMAGSAHFDYDLAQYRVESGYSGYGHTHVAIGVGYGWGGWGYNPWTFGIGIGFGYDPFYASFGCWSWCGPGYGFGYSPYYSYGYYPYYGYGYGYGYYPYARYPYPSSAYPYYLHAGYPYTFKPGTGGGIVQPRPRTGGAFVAGFGGAAASRQPGYHPQGFTPRTRTPSRVHSVDPRAGEWDRARMSAGQHRAAPQSAPRGSGGGKSGGGSGRSGGGGGSHGGQAQPRAREPHRIAEYPGLQERGSGRSYYEPRGRSNGGWGQQRSQPSYGGQRSYGGRFESRGFSGGGRSAAPRTGGGGGGSRGLAMPRGGGGGGGGGGARSGGGGRHR